MTYLKIDTHNNLRCGLKCVYACELLCKMSPGCRFWSFCTVDKDNIKEKGKHISSRLKPLIDLTSMGYLYKFFLLCLN